MANSDLSTVLPRVLIVSRRTIRKNKFVDFVGEYHLDLIVRYGAVPVIVPRVTGLHTLLESFQPIHGVLLCEGEDVDPSNYDAQLTDLSPEDLHNIRSLHPSDTAIDKEKDSIELSLAKLCLEGNIPFLGICRGAQILNVSCGGTLYQDVEKALAGKSPETQRVAHINYQNYDGHRHLIRVVADTPLHDWFEDSLDANKMEIMVNSYHHQGVKRLEQRFVPMAFAPDGLIEGFYDPNTYNPEDGKFLMGLQFHPERMRHSDTDEFDYPGCTMAYQEFVKAVIAYKRKLCCSTSEQRASKLSEEMELRRKVILKSFSVARNIYKSGSQADGDGDQSSELKAGADFLQANAALSLQQENRLKQVGATIRNGSIYTNKVKMNHEREKVARTVMGNMSVEQLSELMSFYGLMRQICSETLDRKLHELIQEET